MIFHQSAGGTPKTGRIIAKDAVPNIHVWRYMDVFKFLSLLDKEALFFTRIDKMLMDDHFEGAYTPADVQVQVAGAKQFVADTGGTPAEATQLAEAISKSNAEMPGKTYITCWHKNECESMAMWSMYAGVGKGIAIKVNLARLHAEILAALSHDVALMPLKYVVGEIQYIDYSTGQFDPALYRSSPLFAPFLHKRKSYEYEKEIRVGFMVTDGSEPPEFISIPISLNTVIDAIVVSPKMQGWMVDTIKYACTPRGLVGKVNQSAIDAPAIY